MNRDKALERLSALETEAKELRMIITAPEEPDYSQWIGKWGFYSDENPDCPDDGVIRRLVDFLPIKLTGSTLGWRYFRPATAEELGFAGPEPDWSKAPDGAVAWTQDADGQARWHAEKPMPGSIGWISGRLLFTDKSACPNWRDSLRERPQ